MTGESQAITSTSVDPVDAIAFQKKMAQQVICHDTENHFGTVTGVDVAYAKDSDVLVAAAVTLDAQTLDIVEKSHFIARSTFPYISGLFSFRELPPILGALEKLSQQPELIICDGQGIAHPRGFGLASHLGIAVHIPTIGCAKTRMFGSQIGDIGIQRGETAPLTDDTGSKIGAVLRTQNNVKPLFVSVGHMISLQASCDWVLKCAPQYRLPETTRTADHEVKIHLNSLTSR